MMASSGSGPRAGQGRRLGSMTSPRDPGTQLHTSRRSVIPQAAVFSQPLLVSTSKSEFWSMEGKEEQRA